MWMSNTSSFKNKIMNGNFDIWQRGTTVSTVSHQYLADRWDSYAGGTSVARAYSKSVFTPGQTAVPGEPSNYATINITNGGDATNGNVQLLQHIENVRTIAGKKVTLSFWAKATSALKLGVAYTQGFGSGGSPSVDVSASTGVVTLSTNWTKYVQTFTLPSISGKTVGTDGEQTSFTKIQFFMSAGTALVAIAPTVGVQTGTFDIAQVQLELGDTATDFESRPYQVELALCQRYFYEAWGLSCTRGRNALISYATGGTSGGAAFIKMVHPVPLRIATTPTIVGNIGLDHNNTGSASVAVSPVFSSATSSVNSWEGSISGAQITYTTWNNGSGGEVGMFLYSTANGSNYIWFNADF